MKIASAKPIGIHVPVYSQWNIEKKEGRKRRLLSERKRSRQLQTRKPTDTAKMVLGPLILELLNHEASSPLDQKNNGENLKGQKKHQPP